ncbi:hypothetical protein ACTA71_000198 [Dictyostelium dimigraforme]
MAAPSSNYQLYGLKIGFPPGGLMRNKQMKFNDYGITVKEAVQIITNKQGMQNPDSYTLQITYSDEPSTINTSSGNIGSNNSSGNTPLNGSIGMGPPPPSASIGGGDNGINSSIGSSSNSDLKKSTSSGIVNISSGNIGSVSTRRLKWMDDNEKLISYPLGAHDVVIELKKKYQLIKVYDGKQTMNLIVDIAKPLSDLMDLVSCKFKLRSTSDCKLFTYGKEINLNSNIKNLNIDTSLPFILRDNNDPSALSLESIQWDNGNGFFVGGNGGIGGIGSDDDADDINNNLSVPAKSIINPVREGYLKKQDKKKSWKTRYFKLTDKYLYWYKSPTAIKASGMIICKDYHIKLVQSTHSKEVKLEITPKHMIAGATTIIHYIKFENEQELKQWTVLPIVIEPSNDGGSNNSSSSSTTSTTTSTSSGYQSNTIGKKIFGVPIEKTVSGNNEIPSVVLQTIDYIEKKAMDTVGIFRLSGSVLTIEQWKAKYDKGEKVDLFQEVDPHAVAGLLKLYLRELPDPLLTYEKYDNFIAAQSIDDFPSRIKLIKHLVKSLPPVNYSVLSYLMAFVGKVATHSAANKMQVHNLSTVFGPNLIKDRQDSGDYGGNVQVLVEDTPIINALALSLIRDYQYIFTDKEIPEQKILAKALYEYAGANDDGSNPEDDKDLLFPKGATIKVTQQGTDGWWTGEYQGKQGKFPASYVEILPHSPSTLLRTKSNSNLTKKKKFMLEMESTKTKNQEIEKNIKQLEITKKELESTINDLENEKASLENDPTIKAMMSLLANAKTNKDIAMIPKNIDVLFQRFEEYKASHEALATTKTTLIDEYEQFNNNPKKRLDTKEKEQIQQKYDNLSTIIDKSQKIRSKSINSKKIINDDLVELKKIFSL